MGQCTSRKATGSLTTKSTFVSHIKPIRMDKPGNFKGSDDEEGRKIRVSTDKNNQLLGAKKPQPRYSKGVAMSFGFKRRPAPTTINNGPIARDFENVEASNNDPNGNKEETSNCPTRNQTVKVRNMHKVAPSQKPASITSRPSRFGFPQTTTDRANKVSDIKTSPIEFGGVLQNVNKSRVTSPSTETDVLNDRYFSRPSSRNVSNTGTRDRLTSPTTETDILNDRRRGTTFFRSMSKVDTVNRQISPSTEEFVSMERRLKTSSRTMVNKGNVGRVTSPSADHDVSPDLPTKTFTRNIAKTGTLEKLTSPTSEQNTSDGRRFRTFTRNVSKVEATERRRSVIDNNDNGLAVKDRPGSGQIQMGKFTFQTTRLPQPEPIRVIETKTAKTIANNNKRFARIRRQFEEAALKVEDDSGFGSNTSGYVAENDNDPTTNLRYTDRTLEDNRVLQTLRRNTVSLLENSDSFSETSTPPPLPELPCVFRSDSPISINTETEFGCKEKHDNKRPFIKLGSQRTFLKSRTSENDSTPQSPSEQDWVNAGEAMAEDVSLLVSPKHKTYESKDKIQDHNVSTCATVIEAALQTLVKPSVTLELTQNLKTTDKMSLLDEDPNFTAVAANNKTGHLLDEEILSPVESLLSCSETEEILKKKMTHSSSNSKDINEKLTPPSPDTPSNGTYSLSLSDDKEDFLIDDEIADQPELVFEDTINNGDNNTFNYNADKISEIFEHDSMRNQRGKSCEMEASPFSSRRKRDFLRSMTGSIDSLSPCESIASDDLMMEFDISQSNDIESCDRRSGSFSSLDDTLKFRLKSDDRTIGNKNLFKSSFSKPVNMSKTETPNYIKESPRMLRRKFSYQSSPEHTRSPKNNSLHPFGYNSVAYDPTSDCLMLTKANHSAIQQDIIGIKTMLITLKRVLNESETRNSLNSDTQMCTYENDSIQNNNNNNNNEFKVELADLRRQVIFLQGQLEDKENTVDNLQKQIDSLANQNNPIIMDTPLVTLDIQKMCNAATQTDRIRPISSGSLTLSGSSMDDSLVRKLVNLAAMRNSPLDQEQFHT